MSRTLAPKAPTARLAFFVGSVVAALGAAGCDPADADADVGRPGAPAAPAAPSELRRAGAFHGIDLAGTIAVEARIGPDARVEVFGDPARRAQVITEVRGGILRVDTRGKLDKARLRVVVTAPRLDALAVSGTGELRASGFAGGALALDIGGTGAAQLAGRADSLRLTVSGVGEVRARDLVVADATIDIAGTADARVHATRSLDARLSGTGAIRVDGRPPRVTKAVTGTGVIDLR